VRLDGDPYDLPGVARELAKIAWNVAVNAPSVAAARRAISAELRGLNRPSSFAEVDKILEGLARRTPGFERAWGSGLGLRLQFVDAEICRAVQRTLRSCGVVALSVHDSFLVQARASQALLGAMDDALGRALRKVLNGLP
jgi:hypothetical protein